MYMCDLIVYT